MRRCVRCGEFKPATTENFLRNGRGGLRADCRQCYAAWRSLRRQQMTAAEKAPMLAKSRERSQRWYRSNKARHAEYGRRWNLENADRKKSASQAWSRKNQDKVRKYARDYAARVRQSAKVRLHEAISKQIYNALKGHKNGQPWEEVIGYTCASLMRHLERQFESWMSWDNYGEWHVDHILPVSSFSFSGSNDDDFRACWALTNLRPLSASDNCSKGSRRTLLI